jgi:hypothetical protein
MKKGRILSVVNETVEKTYLSNMNEDSYFDGHKFVDYGKNIENISLIMPSIDEVDYSIDKKSLVIKWGARFEFRNSGIESVIVEILDIQANLIANGETSQINFGEYQIQVTKEKNVENKDLTMYVTSIEVDAEQKIVNVVVSI